MNINQMNKDAVEFFARNPDETYWYYSPTLRVANPWLKPWRWAERTPWPDV